MRLKVSRHFRKMYALANDIAGKTMILSIEYTTGTSPIVYTSRVSGPWSNISPNEKIIAHDGMEIYKSQRQYRIPVRDSVTYNGRELVLYTDGTLELFHDDSARVLTTVNDTKDEHGEILPNLILDEIQMYDYYQREYFRYDEDRDLYYDDQDFDCRLFARTRDGRLISILVFKDDVIVKDMKFDRPITVLMCHQKAIFVVDVDNCLWCNAGYYTGRSGKILGIDEQFLPKLSDRNLQCKRDFGFVTKTDSRIIDLHVHQYMGLMTLLADGTVHATKTSIYRSKSKYQPDKIELPAPIVEMNHWQYLMTADGTVLHLSSGWFEGKIKVETVNPCDEFVGRISTIGGRRNLQSRFKTTKVALSSV